jgi:hypothetical protein
MADPDEQKATWTNAPFTKEELDHIIDLIAKRHSLRRADAEKLVTARTRATKRNPLLEQQWVEVSHNMCEAIRSGRATSFGLFATVFWIRLYACLTDLRERYQVWTDAHVDVPPSWPPYRWLAACAEVAAACDALHDCLSDEELVYVAFLRQVHAHVCQDGFEYTIERGNPEKNQPGAVRTKQTVRPLRRHVEIEEVHEIVDRIHKEHGNDEHKITIAFAEQTSAALGRLRRAMIELKNARDAANASTLDGSAS